MEAQGRRFSGGFPGYDGPAPPRAMRSSRGRGEAARRQSVVVPHKGRFELLATVAGRILQDTGVNEGQDKPKANEQESLKENSPSEIDSQVSSVGSVTNHIFTDKRQSATVLSVAPTVVVPGQLVMNEEELQVAGAKKNEGVVGQGENSFENFHSEAAVCSLSQEEQSKAVEKVTLVDQDSVAPVNIVSSTPADQELLPPPSYSDLSTAKFDPTPASPSIEIKEITSIESLGRCTEMQQYQENFEIIEMVSEEIMEDKKQATLGSVGIIGLGNMEFELPLMTQEKPMEKKSYGEANGEKVISVECCKENRGCSEAIGEVMAMLDGPVTVVNEASSSIPEFQSSESGDFMKLASPIYLQEDKDEENVSMEMEDKGIVVNEKTPPSVATSGCSKFVSSGLAEGHNSRPMLKRVMCKRDVKFSRTKKMNSSQHLLQETMTKKLKNSYSKASDAQKVAKAVKSTHLSKTSIKRHHTDMESTDSGSSQEAGSEKETLYGGIAGLTWQRRTRRLSSKRKKMVDGRCNPEELHLNNVNLMEMGYEYVDGEPPAAAAKLRSAKAASVASSPTAKRSSKLSSKKSLEPHSPNTVTLSIKSFTVPELFVDLPESASILNLKRAVMEAAMNLLGGGLRVRVLLQGKKVPDEAVTLLQLGISHNTKPESLDFMLEPSPLPTSSSATAEDPLLVLSHAASPPVPRCRYPVFGAHGLSGSVEGHGRCIGKGQPTRASEMVVDADPTYGMPPMPADEHQFINKKQAGLTLPITADEMLKGGNGIRSKMHLHDRMPVSANSMRVPVPGALAAIHAQIDTSCHAKNELDPTSTMTSNMSQESFEGESGAIVLHPSMGTGDNLPGLALVPVRQKISCALEVGKRRMRRPFSVAEVEALVHAVEKLGTGRWRDVKLRAFDQAKHRTYVDLKDKWKTLVHTARIAPHQRRGEPVPQELLERVIQAHSYWTAQAAKQQAELDS